jgi:small subunit ribosomal protein S20
MRSSARRRQHNRAIKTELKSLRSKCRELIDADKKDEAGAALKALTSALDKAAKTRVIHAATGRRQKSRLAAAVAALE